MFANISFSLILSVISVSPFKNIRKLGLKLCNSRISYIAWVCQ
nr:MAG TPA: hypothetical protein [Caudoviricetes sp.]